MRPTSILSAGQDGGKRTGRARLVDEYAQRCVTELEAGVRAADAGAVLTRTQVIMARLSLQLLGRILFDAVASPERRAALIVGTRLGSGDGDLVSLLTRELAVFLRECSAAAVAADRSAVAGAGADAVSLLSREHSAGLSMRLDLIFKLHEHSSLELSGDRLAALWQQMQVPQAAAVLVVRAGGDDMDIDAGIGAGADAEASAAAVAGAAERRTMTAIREVFLHRLQSALTKAGADGYRTFADGAIASVLHMLLRSPSTATQLGARGLDALQALVVAVNKESGCLTERSWAASSSDVRQGKVLEPAVLVGKRIALTYTTGWATKGGTGGTGATGGTGVKNGKSEPVHATMHVVSWDAKSGRHRARVLNASKENALGYTFRSGTMHYLQFPGHPRAATMTPSVPTTLRRTARRRRTPTTTWPFASAADGR